VGPLIEEVVFLTNTFLGVGVGFTDARMRDLITDLLTGLLLK